MTALTATQPTVRLLWAALAAVEEVGTDAEHHHRFAKELVELSRPDLLAFLNQVHDVVCSLSQAIEDLSGEPAELHLNAGDFERLHAAGAYLTAARAAALHCVYHRSSPRRSATVPTLRISQ